MTISMPIIGTLAALTTLGIAWMLGRKARQADYIRTYMFPPGLIDKIYEKHPQLGLKERQIVARALRQFFLAYLKSGRKFVSMPSQVADDMWHEFILYTRHYDAFCKKAFGRYLHHTPAAVLGQASTHNEGLRRVWWHACIEENINPRKPTRLPLLFALDVKYNIAGGFRYHPQCQSLRKSGDNGIHCGSDFGDAGFDGGTSGFSDISSSPDSSSGSDASSGSDSGCGGGCSGGCGGGD